MVFEFVNDGLAGSLTCKTIKTYRNFFCFLQRNFSDNALIPFIGVSCNLL
jgi:hypothetical protein